MQLAKRQLIGSTGLIGLIAFALCGPLAAQDDVQIKTIHVAGSVYMLTGQGGNIGVSAGSDGLLMIDDQFAPLADKIRAALDALDKGELQFVLNTHWHGDHTGGNESFGRQATIVAHSNVRKRLATKQSMWGRDIPPKPKHGLPVITFDQSLSFHFNDEEIEAIHLPNGHTDGDSAVFFPSSNVVHMGDHFFSGTFPFVDLEHGGDVEGLTANVAATLKKLPKNVKIIPGHGPLSDYDDLKAYHEMLVDTTSRVRKAIANGESIEAIQSAGLGTRWKSWGGGFISTQKWIDTLHASLTRK